ncbi:MAG: formyltransferase family protein [Chitinophagales bacterium]
MHLKYAIKVVEYFIKKMIINLQPMGVTLLLCGKKGLAVLEAIVAQNIVYMIHQVVIAKDQGVLCDYADEIMAVCSSANVKSCFSEEAQINSATGKVIAIGWQRLLPVNGNNVIVLHDSLLPAYRGFSPLVSQLLREEPLLGVTAFIANNYADSGDIVFQESVAVTYPLSIQSAIDLLIPAYVHAALFLLHAFSTGSTLKAYPQAESASTFSLWRDEADYRINWSATAHDIHQFVLAHGFPYKGASTICKNQLIRIDETVVLKDMHIVNRVPGKVIFLEEGLPVVVCGKGLLKIKNAHYDSTGALFLPVKNLRTRFQ